MKILINILLIAFVFSCDTLQKNNSADENLAHQKFYYDSGKLLSQGFKKGDSLYVGTWIMYRENGEIRAIKSYDMNGIPDGIWQYFYSNGFIHSYRTYKKDTIDGIEISYTSKGELIQKRNWDNGQFYGNYDINYGDSLCQDNSTKYKPDSTGELLSTSDCVNCRWVERTPTLNEIEDYRKQMRK